MKGYVDGFDWYNAEAMKYWSIPSSYNEEKGKTEIKNAIFSGQYYGALKVDGYYQRLIKDEDGNCFMVARSKNVKGEPTNKYDWVPQLHKFMDSLPNGTVLLSECYLRGNEGSQKITSLLGCLKEKCIERQKKDQYLSFYIFDICAYDGKNLINTPFKERINILTNLSLKYKTAPLNSVCSCIAWAEYFYGETLWNELQNYLASGREGIVITREDCPIYFKRTPAHMTIKVKKELKESLDCFFTGRATPPTRIYSGISLPSWEYWEDPITKEKLKGNYYREYMNGAPIEPVTKSYFNGMAGSLEIGVLRDGKVYPIGYLSGLSDEIKSNYKDYTGKCLEVGAMQFTDGNNALRHAKMIRLRPDLNIEDCTWEKLGL